MRNKTNIKLGMIFSETGSYAALGQSMRAGAMLAIDEINANDEARYTLEPIAIDPGGETAAYAEATRELISNYDITHVFGCYTSASRKEVLPVIEKYDALLWYPSHYEGFETSDNVVYTGASPNQHILPLARHLISNHGKRGWFVGSNYIWAWENNRILREALSSVEGEVVGERYFAIGDTDFGELPATIVADQPDFVFVTLIGDSCYRFIRELRRHAEAAGIDQSTMMPIASCSLSEAELPLLGADAAGHLSSSVYFSSVDTPENHWFTERWNAQFSHLGRASADAEASFVAIHLLANALERAADTSLEAVRDAVRGIELVAPQGPVAVNQENLHCAMRPRIGRSTHDYDFEIIHEARQLVQPDPYLVWVDPLPEPESDYLRVVK